MFKVLETCNMYILYVCVCIYIYIYIVLQTFIYIYLFIYFICIDHSKDRSHIELMQMEIYTLKLFFVNK